MKIYWTCIYLWEHILLKAQKSPNLFMSFQRLCFLDHHEGLYNCAEILWGLYKPHKSATNGKKSPVLYSTQGLSLCDNSHQIFCTLFHCKCERQKDPNILYITHTLKSASIGPKSALQTLSLKSVTKGTKFHFHTISCWTLPLN